MVSTPTSSFPMDDVSTQVCILYFYFYSIFFFYIFFSTQLFSMAPAQPVQRSSSKCLKYGYPVRNRVATEAGQNIEKVTKVWLTVRVARIS